MRPKLKDFSKFGTTVDISRLKNLSKLVALLVSHTCYVVIMKSNYVTLATYLSCHMSRIPDVHATHIFKLRIVICYLQQEQK